MGTYQGDKTLRISGLIFHGVSTKAVNKVSGYVRSNINAEQRRLYVSAASGLVPPDQIVGIPPGAKLEIQSPFIPVEASSLIADVTKMLDEPTFLERFGDFTLVIELDGQKEEHRFSRDDIDRMLAAGKRVIYGVPRPQIIAAPKIIWKWDEGDWYFLGAVGGVGDRTWIVTFQARGLNATGGTIQNFGGYVESEITGERLPIALNIGGQLRPITPTARIAEGAEFDIGTRFPDQYPEPRQAPNQAGISADKFREQWRSFKFAFEYAGHEYVRRFTADDIERSLRKFHDATHRDVKPRVTR